MATKSFLSEAEIQTALREKLLPPSVPPNGDERVRFSAARAFAQWLEERLLLRLAQHPLWEAAGAIALGSWSRGELSPRSDIDLLFTGSEDDVKVVVQDFARDGLKLRYRVPANPVDWTEGVLPFDVLALFSGRPLTTAAGERLLPQLERLERRRKGFRLELLRAMRHERAARAERYDSISNFLEPNLKYGPGALRDLEQALVTRRLFPERFGHEQEHAFQVLEYYKDFLLLTRQSLHIGDLQAESGGGSDVLAAHEQRRLALWFGYRDEKEFMREIQKGLSRVSFYADWAIARAAATQKNLLTVDRRGLGKPRDLFRALKDDSSILMQNRVRIAADQIFAREKLKSLMDSRVLGRELTSFLRPEHDEAAMVALFRSRLIDHLVPDYRKIVGWVQHDQYHRFSVDAHLLQVLREVKRLRRHPKLAGRFASLLKSLSAREWEILSFSALYHDLAKGRGGDHARKGVHLATADLTRFGKPAAFIREVSWIVEQHLALSAAAFRENPHSPRVWRDLALRGVHGRRIRLLAVFTIVDIRGTNPDAWTPWKERLLFDLVQQLERPEADSTLAFTEALKAKKVPGYDGYLDRLDPYLLSALPPKILAEDLALMLKERARAHAPRVVRVRRGQQTWLRFQDPVDRPGLFLSYVQGLARNGLSVRHASIHTDAHLGVYDWFEIKTTKRGAALRRALDDLARPVVSAGREHTVRFDAIELVSSDEKEWVISFRGRDQSGALSEAARTLSQLGASIAWAKVHTWGRQIDDVFAIAPMTFSSAELIARLRQDLVES